MPPMQVLPWSYVEVRDFLWPPQFPADDEMDDVLRVQTKDGKQGPTRSRQHSQPKHVPLLQEPNSKLVLPAGPYPFSSSLPASHARDESPKVGQPPPLRLFVPLWNQTSSHHPRLMTLALLGGKWPQICPSCGALREAGATSFPSGLTWARGTNGK